MKFVHVTLRPTYQNGVTLSHSLRLQNTLSYHHYFRACSKFTNMFVWCIQWTTLLDISWLILHCRENGGFHRKMETAEWSANVFTDWYGWKSSDTLGPGPSGVQKYRVENAPILWDLRFWEYRNTQMKKAMWTTVRVRFEMETGLGIECTSNQNHKSEISFFFFFFRVMW